MKYSDLPTNKVHIRPTPDGNWSCKKCHWQNPAIFRTCDNCGTPRKEKPCPTQEQTKSTKASGADPTS